MLGENLGLSSPGYWVWLGPALILLIAGLCVWIISHTTRQSISAMARAAGEVLSQAEGFPGRQAAATGSLLVTEGKAETRFVPDSFLLRLVRRFPDAAEGDAMEAARTGLDGLEGSLVASGIDPDDLQGADVASGPDGAIAVLDVVLNGEDRVAEIGKVALQSGFREDRTRPRESFDIDDAQARAGRRALNRAVFNVGLMRESLGLREDVGLVEAHLTVDSAGDVDGLVVMKARATWRVETAA